MNNVLCCPSFLLVVSLILVYFVCVCVYEFYFLCRPFVHPLPPTAGQNKETSENIIFTRSSFQYIKDNRIPLKSIIPLLRLGSVKPADEKIADVTKKKGHAAVRVCATGGTIPTVDEELYFCRDLYYVTKYASMTNINSKDLQILMYRLGSHQNLYKTRQLLQSTDSTCDTDSLEGKLREYVEEIRVSAVKNSKFGSSFCTGDLLNVLLKDDCCDQLYCVEEKRSKS